LRVAVIVVSMLMVATPSEASQSCMSKTEARQHFGSVHIYWHGQDHCWTRHRHDTIRSTRCASSSPEIRARCACAELVLPLETLVSPLCVTFPHPFVLNQYCNKSS
jgi:hypothetical protein